MELRKKILEIIGKPHLASFATVTADGRPWVRYVMPVGDSSFTIRFSSLATSRKVSQIQQNPFVHLACGVTDPATADGYLQIQGTAAFVTTPEERHAYWHEELKKYFTGPEDPNYGIVVVTPYRIEYNDMGTFEISVWTPDSRGSA